MEEVYIPGEGWISTDEAFNHLPDGEHHLVVRDEAGDLEAEVLIVRDDESWVSDAAVLA